ncbi:WD40 repeat domain-containing protein [Calothrix sp. NIES-2098]|uniref:WD40 repeat domain-containing protein n=1 Tax=Calothrix sp. NIES-2098 TaxID=1954171 RepID=UPI000B5DD3DB|nr:WD-repeat protein [Calothrix sp. NIES-2098]
MTLNHIPWKAITVLTLTVVTTAVCGCNTFTSKTQDLITQSSQNSQLLRKLSTDSDSGYSVAYSPEVSRANNPVGSTLASAGAKTVKLWNPSTGKVIRTFTGQAWAVNFSPDGQILASGSQNGTLSLWNVSTGELIRTLKHSEPVIDVVFSPDGQTLASGLDGGANIRLWNWRTGEIIRIPDDFNASRRGFDNFKSVPIAFSPDGQTFFARSGSGQASQLWNVSTGKVLSSFDAKSLINDIAITPDGKTLAAGIRDNAIKLWNVNSGKLIHTLTGHTGEVRTVAFSLDGKTLASGSQDGTIKLWNVKTGKIISTFKAQTEKVWSVAFNPDGKTFASGSQDGTIKIWQIPQ